MSIKSFNTSSVLKKMILVIVALIVLVVVLYSTILLLGNSVSRRAPNLEVARFTVGIAPSDPQTHFALAVMHERSWLPEDRPKSLAEYERSVSLSPYDYRFWLALGKARERSGDAEGSEKALLRAIELAPNYSQAQWAYGNVLLRRGKTEEAFREIRRAVDNDPKFASPAATTAWQIFDGDIEKVKQTIGDSPPVKSALATFLARQKRFDEAYEIWRLLPKDRLKTDFKSDSERIAAAFLAAKKYKKVLEIRATLAETEPVTTKVGEVTNGGFETDVKVDKPKLFEWNIAQGAQPRINISSNEKKSGSRSLILNFKIVKRNDFRAVSQTVVLDGGNSYRFEVSYKSDLDTSATLKWEVFDTFTRKVLASTDALEKSSDWTSLGVDFELPEESEGVVIRLVRVGCASAICPINGKVWFDDVVIK